MKDFGMSIKQLNLCIRKTITDRSLDVAQDQDVPQRAKALSII